jgi:ankyrin repeat protein
VNGKPDAVRALLELGAEPFVRDPDGRTLREIAEAQDRHDIVALLDAYAPSPPPRGNDRKTLIARFLSNACPDHHVRGRPAHELSIHTAARLLERHPEIARDSIYTAVVCGDLEYVRKLVADHPELARQRGGPKGSYGAAGMTYVVDATGAAFPKWDPLLYLCFTRLDNPASNDNAVAIAELLLDNGADPNSYFMAGGSRYSPLVGVCGEGEEDRPPHPRRDELARLLIDRGATPWDMQVCYNIHFHGRALWFLKLIYEHSAKTGQMAEWKDPSWSMIGMGGFGEGARYFLKIAIDHGDVALAEWCLAHGADPNAAAPRRRRPGRVTPPEPSLHELAMRQGQLEIADLLLRFGAHQSGFQPTDEDRFVAACLRLDRTEAKRLADEHPQFTRSPKAMFEAAQRDNVEAMLLLTELGTSIEVEDDSGARPLHAAAWSNAVNAARLLVERGAEIDPIERNWGNSPIDTARWFGFKQIVDLLAPGSRDLWSLAISGKVERLRDLLTADPKLATAVLDNGVTPLMRLPDDEAKAYEIAKMFLERGADPRLKNTEGLTAIDMAEKRGLDDVAVLLRGAG